jgi:hypothetical protein
MGGFAGNKNFGAGTVFDLGGNIRKGISGLMDFTNPSKQPGMQDQDITNAINNYGSQVEAALNNAAAAAGEHIKGFYAGAEREANANADVSAQRAGITGSPIATALKNKFMAQNNYNMGNQLSGIEAQKQQALAGTASQEGLLKLNEAEQQRSIKMGQASANQQLIGQAFSTVGSLVGSGENTLKGAAMSASGNPGAASYSAVNTNNNPNGYPAGTQVFQGYV